VKRDSLWTLTVATAIHVICVMNVYAHPQTIDATEASGKVSVMDYTERLHRMANNDPRVAADFVDEIGTEPQELDPKTLALVRMGALVAVNGAVPSFGAHADAAVNAGATVNEIVAVLFGVVPIVGLPRVVAAAPKLAMALGYDTDDDVNPRQFD
jgi:4-carboxymuconolactone decarboxylase